MATEVVMPKLGMTMTEGTVAEWLVADGAPVRRGEPVFRLETEKIEFQVEAEADGIVRHLVPAGTVVAPGATVGLILAEGEELPAGGAPTPAGGGAAAPGAGPAGGGAEVSPAASRTAEVRASPAARRLARERGVDLGGIRGTGPGGRIVEADVLEAERRQASGVGAAGDDGQQAGGEIAASPIARRLARQLGLELRAVRGTGPGGRITKDDVEAAAASSSPSLAGEGAAQEGPAPAVIPMKGMRKVIAERMQASLREMAQLSMSMEVPMDEAMKLRAQLISEWEGDGIRPTFTDLVIRAVAKALRKHPRLNAEVTPEGIELRPEINIGMAVALEDGLVVPVIRNAPALSLRDLSRETRRLAEAARAGRLGLDDYAGGTFSVTSLGMSGVDFFTPIVNPPNVAILGVGRIREGVRWSGTTPLPAQQLTLSLTIDHRAIDGAPGAAFLAEVRDLLAAPYRLLV